MWPLRLELCLSAERRCKAYRAGECISLGDPRGVLHSPVTASDKSPRAARRGESWQLPYLTGVLWR